MTEASQKSTINALYVVLVVSIVQSFVPSMTAQAGSLALLLATLVAAYVFKARDREDGLLYNHMTYLIGTIWIGTTVILLGMMIAGAWVYLEGDQSAFHAAAADVQNGVIPTEDMMQTIMSSYMADNRALLFKASAISVGPAILYFLYRVVNGVSRAAKGYRIAKPKGWL